jgi:hypothetical protein
MENGHFHGKGGNKCTTDEDMEHLEDAAVMAGEWGLDFEGRLRGGHI